MNPRLNDKDVKSFAKMFALPIPVPKVEYIEYYVDLLDPFYETKKKWGIFLREFDKHDDFVSRLPHVIREKMMKDIESKTDYHDFLTFDLSTLKNQAVQKKDLYIHEHAGKYFLSVDLVKANFQSFNYKGFDIFNGAETFEDYVRQFTDSEIVIESKILRQVLFGNLNPKRQQSIQKEMIRSIKQVMEKTGLFENEIVSLSSDELYVEVSADFNENIGFLKNKISEKGFNVRVEHFELVRPFEQAAYYKRFTDGAALSFGLVPKSYMAQFIKSLQSEGLTETDLFFINSEGILSKTMQPVYTAAK